MEMRFAYHLRGNTNTRIVEPGYNYTGEMFLLFLTEQATQSIEAVIWFALD